MPQFNECLWDGTNPGTGVPYDDTPVNGTGIYPIPFPYQHEEDVLVYVENPVGTYNLQATNTYAFGVNAQNQNTITFNAAPNAGTVWLVRKTELCENEVEFEPGASIRAEDLNDTFTQMRNAIVENREFIRKIDGGGDIIDPSTSNLVAGDGIDITATATEQTIAVDLANNPGLEFDGGDLRVDTHQGLERTADGLSADLGNGLEFAAGEITVDPHNGIEVTADGVAVDLTNINPGLQFTNGDLQVIGNSVNNGGNPVLQNGPSGVTFQSGGGITITGSGSDTVTISAVAGAGGLNFAGTVNCSVAPTAANLNGTQGEAWTADTACGGNNQPAIHADWLTLLANVANGDTIAVGDIIPCSTDDNQGGTAAERANDFSRIPVGGGFGNLQQVTNNGSFTTNSITVGNTAANPRITLNANGNGIFNGQLGTNIADANNAIFVNSTTAPGHTSFAVRGDGRLTIDDADATGNSPNISLNADGTASFRSGEAQIREAGSGGQNRTQLYLNGASTLNDSANALNISRDGTNTINLYYGGSASFGAGNITLNADGKASFGGTNSNAWVNVEVAKDSGTSYGIRVAPYEVTTARGDYFTFVANGPALSGAGTMNEAQRYYARMISSDVGATTNYMFRSEANNSTVAGQTNYNFYAGGNAPNYFAGSVFGPQSAAGTLPGSLDCPYINNQPGLYLTQTSNIATRTAVEIRACHSLNEEVNAINFTKGNTTNQTSAVAGFIRISSGVGANAGTVYNCGANTTANGFVSTSDYRLKENFASLDNAADRVKLLQPKRFNYIGDAHTVDGFIAHEMEAACPAAVFGTKDATEAIGTLRDALGNILEENVTEPDASEMTYEEQELVTPYVAADPDNNIEEQEAVYETVTRQRTWQATGTRPVYQGVDQSKLIPLLTKALQEALERIENLESTTDPDMSSISELTNKVNAIEAENSLVATLVQNISSRLDSIDDAITALQNPSTTEPEVNLIPDEWSQDQRLAAMQELLNEYNSNK